MKVFVGSDHQGFAAKIKLIAFLLKQGYEVLDDSAGTLNPDDDFPIIAKRVVMDMKATGDTDARGVLICGSGQGMCMTANRYKGIRACLGYDRESVRSARNDDDANVLCMAVKSAQTDVNYTIPLTFLCTSFAAAPRYSRRIQEMDDV